MNKYGFDIEVANLAETALGFNWIALEVTGAGNSISTVTVDNSSINEGTDTTTPSVTETSSNVQVTDSGSSNTGESNILVEST